MTSYVIICLTKILSSFKSYLNVLRDFVLIVGHLSPTMIIIS